MKPKREFLHTFQRLNNPKWMVYFDLLGIRKLIANGGRDDWQVLSRYLALRESEGWTTELRHLFFSDTALIVAPDDSQPSFEAIDRIARNSIAHLFQKHIPLRGAVSCDQLYADFEDNIVFGRALVESYEYAEGQDWIGLLLCPSAERQLKSSINEDHYASSEIPWKRRPLGAPERLYACVLGSDLHVNCSNPLVTHLQEMEKSCPSSREKYERTIEFLQSRQHI